MPFGGTNCVLRDENAVARGWLGQRVRLLFPTLSRKLAFCLRCVQVDCSIFPAAWSSVGGKKLSDRGIREGITSPPTNEQLRNLLLMNLFPHLFISVKGTLSA